MSLWDRLMELLHLAPPPDPPDPSQSEEAKDLESKHNHLAQRVKELEDLARYTRLGKGSE